MKRFSFYKPAGLVMNVLLITFSFNACKKPTSEVATPGTLEEFASAKPGPKSGTPTEVRLKLTVNDAVGNNITSDGLGEYSDGSQNVAIYFSTSGNLQFSTSASNNPNEPMYRWLNYNFSDPTPSYPVRGNEQGGFISTIKTNTSPVFTPLQNLTVNQTQCIGLSAGLYTLADGVVNFHRAPTEDLSTTPTAYVYVTRTSATTWTVTPVPPSTGGCSAISNVAALRVNGALYGYYNMPFSFTLTSK